MSAYDVYSYGVVSSSTLYSIRGEFPAAEGYAEIENEQYMTGGEATNSSIVLSRLGAKVRLDGNWLGDDEAGKRTMALLESYGIDISMLRVNAGYKGVREVVFATPETRTIFGTYGQMLEDADWSAPDEQDIVRAKVICLDPFFGEASARVASIASKAGVPVVTVDCRHDDPLLADTAATVVSESYLQANYPGEQLEDIFRRYQQSTSGLVIFTFGARPIWYGRTGDAIRTFDPYSIEAIDTAGAGDSFRAGIVLGFLRGWSDDEMIDFSAALAAIICMRSPGVLRPPSYDEVHRFMRR